MRTLTGEMMLEAWERGLGASRQDAALAVLALAQPERTADEWARLPLGERNAKLLELRAASLGRRLDGFMHCENCGAKLQFTLDALELARGLRAQIGAPARSVAGCRLRPANTLDLLAAARAGGEAEARATLIARTLRLDDWASDDDGDVSAARSWLDRQPPEIVDSLTQAFDSVNAAAEIRIQFRCADCGGDAAVDVDAANFLLDELSRAIRQLLEDVHDLARSYGWSEHAILAMSAARRSAHLELLRT